MNEPDPQPPIIVPRDREEFSAICTYCVHEKNSAFHRERAWSPGEGHEDVTVAGALALDTDEAWVKCPRGHEHLVLRQGSERARNFG